jgi:membrane-associated protein
MEVLHTFIDTFLHLDQYLAGWIDQYQNWIYVILFAIIFVETGIVIWPWLPGDSLLFAAGAFCAIGSLNIFVIIPLLFIAAVLGDTSNYFIGKYFGERAMRIKWRGKPILKREHLDKTHAFYEKYGAKTIVLARFVPIVRTIAPFVAGMGTMTYKHFFSYNIIGALLWIPSITVLGYIFGQNEFVKSNFEIVVLAIIFISVIPIFIELIKARTKRSTTSESSDK